MINFPVLTYLLVATITITFGNFYFWFRADKNKVFNWLIFFLNIYLFIHAVFILTVRHFFPKLIYFNTVAPFVLVYGPLLYIGIALIRRNKISKHTVYGHLALPMVTWVACVVLIVFYGEGSKFFWIYNLVLTVLTTISLVLYAGYGIASILTTNTNLNRYKLLVMPATLLLLFMAVISIIVPLYAEKLMNNNQATDLISVMIYSLMFATSILVFKYKTSIIFNNENTHSRFVESKIVVSSTKYERSSLTKEQIEDYQEKIISFMTKNQPFLDSTLSLSKLAKFLKMPSHHLTQVLSTSLNESFYNYVNGYRIEFAIKLLVAEANLSMADLAVASGFSSKVSFYRQFKNFKGCTPAVFKKRMLTN